MATAAPSAPLPLFYNNIEPLNSNQHGKIILRPFDMGMRVACSTAAHLGCARNEVMTYANSTSVSHLKTRAIVVYEVHINRAMINAANMGVQ